jgi:uncharacterized membrane protein
MFDQFREFSSGLRIAIFAALAAVLIGVFILVGVLATGGVKPNPKSTTSSQVKDQNPPSSSTPNPVTSHPTTAAQNRAIAEAFAANPTYTAAQKQSLELTAWNDYKQYCLVTSTETNDQREARLQPYFVPGAYTQNRYNIPPLMTGRECVMTSVTPQSINKDGTVSLYVSFQQGVVLSTGPNVIGSLLHPTPTPTSSSGKTTTKPIATVSDNSSAMVMKLVKGQWLIESVTENSGNPYGYSY